MKLRTVFLTVPVSALALAGLAAGGLYYKLLNTRASWDGTLATSGLHAKVEISRDAHGRAAIQASDRHDALFALGFVEAQDRFFEMDLARRRATGETAELLGKTAVADDSRQRSHGFRKRAEARLQTLDTASLEALQAFADGINAGLKALGSRPWQYQVLGVTPKAWKVEDALLVDYSWQLAWESKYWIQELARTQVRDRLGSAFTAFFTDASAPVPGPRILNLRTEDAVSETSEEALATAEVLLKRTHPAGRAALGVTFDSRNGVLSGTYGRDDGDWYPASLSYGSVRLAGVTVPGFPVFPSGTNGKVSWASTPSPVDTADTVILPRVGPDEELYTYSGKTRPVLKESQTLSVRGADDVAIEVVNSDFGPVVGRGLKNQYAALQWTAYAPSAAGLELLGLDTAANAKDAADLVRGAGIPNARFTLTDTAGQAFESYSGKYPVRYGFEGDLPVLWSFGDRGWKELVSFDPLPIALKDLVKSEALPDTFSAPPAALKAKASVIPGATEAAWKQALGEAAAKVGGSLSKDLLRVASEDSGEKDLLTLFRSRCVARLFGPTLAPCLEEPGFEPSVFDLDAAALASLQKRPMNLLPPRYKDWDDLLAAALDDTFSGAPGLNSEVPLSGLRGKILTRLLRRTEAAQGRYVFPNAANPKGIWVAAGPVSNHLSDRGPAEPADLTEVKPVHALTLTTDSPK